ncbi:hypothetical protein [Octadecabacter ascidiaceicola]|uniref:hypothetical protein n=1 Tax=Octadecabacter ascidiaceicola TaxID=1655543 RepID=UPI0015C5CB9B|nr:hypothetical protein [Octadecabacter ascidiaceicola]
MNVRLTGDLLSGVVGNTQDNILIGNAAYNVLGGGNGTDVVQYDVASTETHVSRNNEALIVTAPGHGTVTLANITTFLFKGVDISTAAIS